MEIRQDEVGDWVCEHGTAMDVHCCGCHSGYIFDPDHECPHPAREQPAHDCIEWNSGGACFICRRALSIEEQ